MQTQWPESLLLERFDSSLEPGWLYYVYLDTALPLVRVWCPEGGPPEQPLEAFVACFEGINMAQVYFRHLVEGGTKATGIDCLPTHCIVDNVRDGEWSNCKAREGAPLVGHVVLTYRGDELCETARFYAR